MLVDAGTEGFEKGRNLDKIGQHSADTSELFFSDVRVPKTNILGGEGAGFVHLMEELPQDRLSIAVSAQGGAQRAFDEAVKFTKDRKAFGRTVFEFQNTKFTLADLQAKLQVGQALAYRNAVGMRRCVSAIARRRGLHERIYDRAAVARCAGSAHLWRNQRDHEGSDLAFDLR